MNCETTLIVSADHPAFAGHFPGMPILPGVVLLDEVLHALSHAMGSASGGNAGSFKINSAKFLSPVKPGETLTISCTDTAAGSTRFEITGLGRTVATGILSGASAQ